MRLNQYIAKATGISRRKADEEIKSKKVKVNGSVGELSHQVVSSDAIEYYDGKHWKSIAAGSQEATVLLMYKPPRVVTTRSDPEGRKTIYDLLPREYEGYKSAGRLDYMSEGLLVLSSNGHLILSLTHPKFKTKKTYLVGLSKPLSASDISQAGSGSMVIDDYQLNPVQITKVPQGKFDFLRLDSNLAWYQFTLTEGRNRQIRKMMQQINKPVIRLIRVGHGIFNLNQEIVSKGFSRKNIVQ
jgi:23S rRNA pseudouridine2605 synthase